MVWGYPPFPPQGSNPMELLCLPIPTETVGSCGNPGVTHWTPASTAFTNKTQTVVGTTCSCGKEDSEHSLCCPRVWRYLRAWPGGCEDLLDHLAPTSLKKTLTPFKYIFKSFAQFGWKLSQVTFFSMTSLGKLHHPVRALSYRPSPALQPTFALAQSHCSRYIFTYHTDKFNTIQKFSRVKICITKTRKRK